MGNRPEQSNLTIQQQILHHYSIGNGNPSSNRIRKITILLYYYYIIMRNNFKFNIKVKIFKYIFKYFKMS